MYKTISPLQVPQKSRPSVGNLETCPLRGMTTDHNGGSRISPREYKRSETLSGILLTCKTFKKKELHKMQFTVFLNSNFVSLTKIGTLIDV